MDKEKKILKDYLLYFSTLLLTCIIGITNIFADTTIDTSTWVNVTGRNWSITGQEFYSGTQTFNNDVLLNHYNVTGGVYTPPNQFDYITYSFFEHSTSPFNPCNSTSKFTATFKLLFTTPSFVNYVDSVKWGNENCSISNKNTSTGWLDVSCIASPSTGNYTDIFVNYTTISGTATSDLYITRNIDIACGLNTDAIINNDNANTQNIINNNNNNTQEIINNNNQNTQDIIDSNKVCSNINVVISQSTKDNFSTIGYLQQNGSINNNNQFVISDYISVFKDTTYTLTRNTGQGNGTSYCLYDETKELLSCSQYGTSLTASITPIENGYVRFSGAIYDNVTTTFKGTACKNGNQALSDDNEEAEKTRKGILGKLKDLFDTLFSNDDADVSGLDNMVGWLPPGPVDSIINLPLAFFNALTNTLTGTCQSVSIPIPFVNQTLVLPCFDAYMSQYLTGFNTLWTLVGTILSVFILYYYLLSLYKWVDDTLTFRENNLPGYYDDNWGGGA